MESRLVVVIAAILGLAIVARAAEPDPEIVNAEKTLQEAKVETTGAALLQYFRERTLKPADRAGLADAVRRLGNDDFETREKAEEELLRAGRKALPFLRAALRDEDLERARRAARCVQEIDSDADHSRIAAAAHVLAARKPEGAAAVLLAYLPGAEAEFVEEELSRALLTLGMRDGKADPALLKALTDEEPLRRAVAARVLGRLDPTQRPAVRRLLADAEARVRFEAAVGLARSGDKEAVPSLIGLLSKGPMPIAWKAQEILYRIAGDKAQLPALTDDDGPKRVKVADAWTGWWKTAAPTTDLARINLDEALQGVNVICQEAGGGNPARVWACRADGKPIWEIKNVMAWDARLLPNGHVLLAEYGVNQVTERDTTGKIVMTVTLRNTLSSCQRLPNGNTFITTFSEILEVDPKGATLWTHANPAHGLIGRSHRLRNGNILYAAAGHKVIETDAAFKEVRTAAVPASGDSWMSLEPLPGNRFLIAPYGAHKVMEIDAAGKVQWECATQTPMSVVRLPNGNTLVGSDRGHAVIEYNRGGKEVWKLDLAGSVRCVRRY
jgi:HEAT repeats/PQQ-like domain